MAAAPAMASCLKTWSRGPRCSRDEAVFGEPCLQDADGRGTGIAELRRQEAWSPEGTRTQQDGAAEARSKGLGLGLPRAPQDPALGAFRGGLHPLI